MITIFKNIRETSTPFHKDVDFVFERIRNGHQKKLIEKIRKEKDKTKRNEIKKNLSAICFSGEFTKRADDAISSHSGLICLDFDDYPSKIEIIDHREALEADKYVMSVFTSPSGNGLKVIVKIPAEPENHKRYFEALRLHFDSEYFDVTSKNISRVCYESYDPKIYINMDSEVWDVIEEEEPVSMSRSNSTPTIAVDDEQRIVDILMKWWEAKYGLVEGERNNNVFVLAKAFNDYGVSRSLADYVIGRMSSKDFPMREIKTTIDSAYRDSTNFNTKFFEDTDAVSKIRGRVLHGELKEKIISEMSHISNIEEVVDEIDKNPSPRKFWTKSTRGGIKIVPILFKQYLEYNGFYKFFPHDSDVFLFVKVTNNLIERINEKVLKDFVLNYLIGLEDLSVYNYFAQQTYLFKSEFLSLLDTVSVHFVEDTKNHSHIYFRNCAVKVTKGDIELIDYVDLDGFVWENQVVDRDFKLIDNDVSCDFKTFISNISGNDESRVRSLESTIGFLMSGFKDPGYCPAVILNDEVITENPEGGTGKGLMVQGVGQLKKLVEINGKLFDFKTQFGFQTLSTDTQVVSFDDVKKGFNFENLFSTITEGITIEKKNKDAIKIPFSASPKLVITTNYAIRGKGNSFERRKWELELKQHYHMNHTPVDEFGRRFFTEWSEGEWLLFDNYMLRNLQLYISEGLIKSSFTNIGIRRLGSETCHEFLEWVGLVEGSKRTDAIRFNVELLKDDIYRDFIQEYPDYAPKAKMTISRSRFYKWLYYYGSFVSGVTVTEGRSSMGRWIIFKKNEEKKKIREPELQF